MTIDEYLAVAEWIEARWPRGWTPIQQTVFFEDLEPERTDRVWGALKVLYEKGLEWAPHASVIKGQIRKMHWPVDPTVPQLDAAPAVPLAEWLQQAGFGSLHEAIQHQIAHLEEGPP